MKGRALGRGCALTGTALVLLLGGAGPAAAVEIPGIPGLGQTIGGATDSVVGGLLDKVCPPREAPAPQLRLNGQPPLLPGVPDAQQGLYARYGMGGLRWTTYDQSCLAVFDTSTGSALNEVANTLDEMVNQTQTMALADSATSPVRKMTVRSLGQVSTAFWSPWMMSGLAAAGLVMAAAMAAGRTGDVVAQAASTVLVLGAVTWILANPTGLPDLSDAATSGVASRVSSGLLAATGTGAQVAPERQVGEGYYRVSYSAWLDGEFCGDPVAAGKYGPALLDAQATSATDYARVHDDPAAQKTLVAAKAKAWSAVAERMRAEDPMVFACWSGASASRFGTAVKHLFVSVFAGFFMVLAAAVVLVLKDVLLLGLLFVVAAGAVMLASRKVTGRMVELLILGGVGAPAVSLGAGVLEFGYTAILSDPSQSWWQATVASISLGAALLVARGPLRGVLTGMTVADRMGNRATRRARRRGGWGSAAAGYAGARAGAKAGANDALDDALDDSGDDDEGDGGQGVPAEPTTTTMMVPGGPAGDSGDGPAGNPAGWERASTGDGRPVGNPAGWERASVGDDSDSGDAGERLPGDGWMPEPGSIRSSMPRASEPPVAPDPASREPYEVPELDVEVAPERVFGGFLSPEQEESFRLQAAQLLASHGYQVGPGFYDPPPVAADTTDDPGDRA